MKGKKMWRLIKSCLQTPRLHDHGGSSRPVTRIKRLGALLLLPGRDSSPSRGLPSGFMLARFYLSLAQKAIANAKVLMECLRKPEHFFPILLYHSSLILWSNSLKPSVNCVNHIEFTIPSDQR